MLLALEYHLDDTKEIVIVSPASGKGLNGMLAPMRTAFVPNRVLTVVSAGEEHAALEPLVPLIAGKVAQLGKTTAYVCANRVCDFPTSDPKRFEEQIRRFDPIE